VSDYTLDDRVRSPAEAMDFSSSLCVKTSSEFVIAGTTVCTELWNGVFLFMLQHPLI
jgi:hypothetical protein